MTTTTTRRKRKKEEEITRLATIATMLVTQHPTPQCQNHCNSLHPITIISRSWATNPPHRVSTSDPQPLCLRNTFARTLLESHHIISTPQLQLRPNVSMMAEEGWEGSRFNSIKVKCPLRYSGARSGFSGGRDTPVGVEVPAVWEPGRGGERS
ncbi:hypothetical protein EX30DRAFT_219704 [Ascodesmis nigricans]|uniref:Uncharacterized protein n=1 Tax=Ascodesmis nigricans TaxID=341454 RepID=A0A4V3SJ09_9PEZI|nr:hypothetical protein EX30DRAFT_219704 [Ascodesmis nigricans]